MAIQSSISLYELTWFCVAGGHDTKVGTSRYNLNWQFVPGWEGGTHFERWQGDVPPLRPAFSGHFLAPETHFFKPFSSSRDPTSICGKNPCIFKTKFCWILPNFSSRDTKFTKHLFLRPQFRAQNQFWRPDFRKAGRHIPTQIFVDYFPGSYWRSCRSYVGCIAFEIRRQLEKICPYFFP